MINPAARMGPVTLNVARLERMRDFYRDVVGLQVRQSTDGVVDLGTPGQTLVRLQRLDNGRHAPRACGLYHLALRVPTRADLGQWLRHYAARSAPNWQGASDHGVSDALYLADPEGNGIEIYRDHPRSRWTVGADGQIVALLHRLDVDALIQAAPDSRWRGLPPETDMGHIHLKVNDLPAARAFYVDVLGFGIKTAYQNSALFVAAGDYHHHIGLNTWHTLAAEPRPDRGYGLAEAAVTVPTAGDVTRIAGRLSSVLYPHRVTAEGACLVHDPAGNPLRITCQKD